jgi:type I restriction enzyme S subunit
MNFRLSDLFEKPISGEWGNEIEDGVKGTKVIRTTNFTNLGRLDLSDVVERDIDLIKYESKRLKKGDIIIEKSGGSPTQPVGRVVIFNIDEKEPYFCNNFTSILRPTEKLYPKYALYLMKRLYDTRKILKFQNQTTGIINLKLNDYISKTEVDIPNLESQKNIANALDKAQELIDKRKEQINLLDELGKSRFIEMFGDIIINPKAFKIEKLEKISSVGSSKRVFVDELVDRGIPFYRGTEIGALSTGENIKPTLFITEEHYNNLKESTGVPKIGDLLMPSICNDGRIWIVNTQEPFYFKDGRVLWIHLKNNNEINSIYLKYMLKEEFTRNYNKIASGTTFAELKIFALKNLNIILPPIQLQNQFADFVTQVDKLKREMENSLKELEDNFNSLMQRAFKGELF